MPSGTARIAVVVCVVLLAGCGGFGATTTETATVTATETTTTVAGETTTLESVDADPEAVRSDVLEAMSAVETYRVDAEIERTQSGNGVTRTATVESSGVFDRAASAAAGWGNDSLAAFRPVGGGAPGHVWVVRFDDAAAATAGETALRESLSTRGNRTAAGWRVAGVRASLTRPDDRTVAMALGPETFVRGVTVTTNAGAIVEISTRARADGA